MVAPNEHPTPGAFSVTVRVAILTGFTIAYNRHISAHATVPGVLFLHSVH
jgi:hypothetical protein